MTTQTLTALRAPDAVGASPPGLTLDRLSLKRKITAIFTDGSRRQNLGIDSTVALLQGLRAEIPVDADPQDPQASDLLNQISAKSGLKLRHSDDAHIFLAQPATEPVLPDLESSNYVSALDLAEMDTVAPPVPPKPELTAADIPSERIRAGLINLGPKEIFMSCDKAFACILGWQAKNFPALPGRFHQELTQTFYNGEVDGQIQSVFKDVKKFGAEAILPKLQAFRAFARESQNDTYRLFRAYLKYGLLPHHQASFIDGRVNMTYFKLYALIRLVEHYEAEQAKTNEVY